VSSPLFSLATSKDTPDLLFLGAAFLDFTETIIHYLIFCIVFHPLHGVFSVSHGISSCLIATFTLDEPGD
jgi:hypothetical protein